MDSRHPDKRKPDVLWKLLKCAVKGLNEVDPSDFSNALKIPGVGLANLTQVLCLINATEFLPTDTVLTSLKLDKFKIADVPTTEYQRHNFSLDRYKEILSSIREIFPGCELYEIGLLAYLISRDNTNSFRNNIRITCRLVQTYWMTAKMNGKRFQKTTVYLQEEANIQDSLMQIGAVWCS